MSEILRITTLVENTAGSRVLLGEHGLSLWIETGDKRVLFDTGQGACLGNNARRLGIDLGSADAIVLSHGHYDHTGGLDVALAGDEPKTMYAHPAAFEPKFAVAGGAARYIGTSPEHITKVRRDAELIEVSGPTELGEGLWLTGPVPRTTDFEDTGGPFFTDREGLTPDELVDDQAAFVQTPSGTVVILGCAHSGVINTLRYVRTLTDQGPIHMVLGGMHLVNAGRKRMDRTIDELRDLDVRRLLACHCTGAAAVARLSKEFPGRCEACPVGTVVKVEG